VRFLKLTFLIIGLLASVSSFAQSDRKAQLQEQKKNLQKEIMYVNSLLKENKKASKYSVAQVRNLDKKISIREGLIENINNEISFLNSSIKKKQLKVDESQEELKLLKEDYARMIQQTYKSKSGYSRIMFLLASDNFNQALKRLEYIDQYSKYRKKQGEKIEEQSAKLEESIAKLKREMETKVALLESKKQEKNNLQSEKGEKQAIVSKLKSRNRKLVRDIKYKQRKSEKLQKEIQKIIAEEIRIARAKAKAERKAKGGASYALTAEAKALSKSFKLNKNKLPWPVKRGVVVSKYGKHPHPTMSNITIVNHGVDIATEKGAEARAVFGGTVTSIILSKGGAKTVLIQHGNYYTVYSNLSDIHVKKGDKVKVKQNLGTIYTNIRTGATVLKFQLWLDVNDQNPANWIYKM
jgi:septal ring factor EnvC (AmiA/AmiB activator)